VPAVRLMAGVAPRQSRSPMPGRRGHRTMAGATSWSSPAPASRPARSPAHAAGTAVRHVLPGSAPRRSGGPCRKDQRAPCASYAHRIRTGRGMPPSYRQANSSCCTVKAGEVNGYHGHCLTVGCPHREADGIGVSRGRIPRRSKDIVSQPNHNNSQRQYMLINLITSLGI